MEIGVYPIGAALMALGGGKVQVTASGHVQGGVDLAAAYTLNTGDGTLAILSHTLHAQTPEVCATSLLMPCTFSP